MDEQNDQFAPETIDEQIEQFPMLLHSEDTRLINDLRTAYHSYRQENADSLDKVWNRIVQSKSAVSSTHAHSNLAATDTHQERIKMLLDYTPDRHKRRKMRTAINTSVVVGIMTTLVASMILVFNLVHNARNGSIAVSSPTKQSVQPAIKDSTGIYLCVASSFSDFEVDKLDLKSHAVLWHYDIGGYGSQGNKAYIVVKGNTVYLTSYTDNGVFALALNANTGQQVWSTNLSAETQAAPQMSYAFLSNTVVDNGTVYIMSEDGQVFALNADTGKQIWKYASGNHFWSDSGGRNNVNSVTVANNVVYGGVRNTLFAVDARNGHQLWSGQVDDYLLLGQPQISGDNLYVSSYERSQGYAGQSQRGFVFAFNTRNGTQIWRYEVGNWVLSPPIVVGNTVYFGSYNTNLYALKASDGSVLWEYTSPGQIFNSPVFDNGILYITQPGNASPTQQNTVQPSMLAINSSNGSVVWEKPIDADISSINAGIIYASMFPRTMVGVDAKTGNILWQEQYGADLIDKLGGHSGPAPSITVVP